MHLARRTFGSTCLAILALGAFATSAFAAPPPPRVPQVPFASASLQGYLNGVGESINVLTDQADAQSFITAVSGNASFTLMIELAGNAPANHIGVYNGDDPNGFPVLFEVFPPIATAGWFASAHFAFGQLVVTLFDQNSTIQGQALYNGVNASNFGFYIQGPAGIKFSQDYRNLGEPHVLTYAGTGRNAGDWWECFEDAPFSDGPPDFDDAVLMLQSVAPTANVSQSWGSIKRLYR